MRRMDAHGGYFGCARAGQCPTGRDEGPTEEKRKGAKQRRPGVGGSSKSDNTN